MKTRIFNAGVLVLLIATFGWASTERSTPAQRKIDAAKAAVKENPDSYQAHNALAMALTLRAKETADPDFYEQALQVLDESFRLSPKNFGAQKIRVWALLGQHNFTHAMAAAQALNREMPDDVMVYGLLVDAYVELGRFAEAEEAAQWMLDLRPGNIPGLTRAAYLRELYGDIEGAIELMAMAYQRIPRHETEDRAWTLTHLGHLYLISGRVETADELLTEALQIFSDYHYALAQLAKVRSAQGNHSNALALLERHYQIAPHPENLYLVGKALAQLGHHEKALEAYERFEREARGEMTSADNANLDLIFYYVDHADRPDEALRIAKIEIESRQNIPTLHAYAWALSANGRYEEARRQIEAVLAVGIRDAEIFYHAGAIASKQGDSSAAQQYFKQAIELNPPSPWADAARLAAMVLTE